MAISEQEQQRIVKKITELYPHLKYPAEIWDFIRNSAWQYGHLPYSEERRAYINNFLRIEPEKEIKGLSPVPSPTLVNAYFSRNGQGKAQIIAHFIKKTSERLEQ